NTGRATVAGGEAAWQQRLAPRWRLDSAATWLPIARLADGTPLAQRAPLRATAALRYGAPGWHAGLAADYAARTPVDLHGSLRVPPRTLLDADYGRSFRDGELGLSLRNVLNVQ